MLAMCRVVRLLHLELVLLLPRAACRLGMDRTQVIHTRRDMSRLAWLDVSLQCQRSLRIPRCRWLTYLLVTRLHSTHRQWPSPCRNSASLYSEKRRLCRLSDQTPSKR